MACKHIKHELRVNTDLQYFWMAQIIDSFGYTTITVLLTVLQSVFLCCFFNSFFNFLKQHLTLQKQHHPLVWVFSIYLSMAGILPQTNKHTHTKPHTFLLGSCHVHSLFQAWWHLLVWYRWDEQKTVKTGLICPGLNAHKMQLHSNTLIDLVSNHGASIYWWHEFSQVTQTL